MADMADMAEDEDGQRMGREWAENGQRMGREWAEDMGREYPVTAFFKQN